MMKLLARFILPVFVIFPGLSAQIPPSVQWSQGVTSSGVESQNGSSIPSGRVSIARTHSSGLTSTEAQLLANWGSITVSCLSDGDASGRTASNGSAQSSVTLVDQITNTSDETIRVALRFELDGESFRGAVASSGLGVSDGSGSARSSFQVGPSDGDSEKVRHISGFTAYQHLAQNQNLYILNFDPVVFELDAGASLEILIRASTAATGGTRSFRNADNELIIIDSAGGGNAASRVWVESVTDLSGSTVTNAITALSGHSYLKEPQAPSFEDWMSLYFLASDSILPTDDEDEDGYDNITEYYAQTRPQRADSSPRPVLGRGANGQWQLEFPVLSRLADYEVLQNQGGLDPDGFESVLTIQPTDTTGEDATIDLPEIGEDGSFYRVLITPRNDG